MEKFIIKGGKKLRGTVTVSGSKNVALKALVAACLTDEEVIIKNVPLISDVYTMIGIIKELGGTAKIHDHTVIVKMETIANKKIALDKAAEVRTSSMFLAPLLSRTGQALVPNPGGCRIGARPIDRTIDGLKSMGVSILYNSEDGFFHAKTKGLHATEYSFDKNTHTGTETMILAGVLAKGRTILKNAAQEPEIDELIEFLNSMGAKVLRTENRTIVIDGVSKLTGTTFVVGPDRNEVVTYAIAAILTEGDVVVEGATIRGIEEFLDALQRCGGGFEKKENGLRFFYKGKLKKIDIKTECYPGFMTDWQSPWAVLMTKAQGTSIIHETVFESRFSYVEELGKMGAHIEFFNPKVTDPKKVYNFNIDKENVKNFRAIRIGGPTQLHNAVVHISDLRAGATLVLAALTAVGETVIFGIEKLDRGYEKLDERLQNLGADIRRERE